MVNVLGMTPLDFGDVGNDADLRACLEQAGFAVCGSWCMGLSLEDVTRVSDAAVNLVVSVGALGVAEALQRTFGTPYVVGLPCAGYQREQVFAALRRAADEGVSTCAFAPEARAEAAGANMLVVGDWVCAASLRSAYRLAGWSGPITVASLFGPRPPFAEPSDVALVSDRALADLVACDGFSMVVGDPLLERIPGVEGARLVRAAHPATSSNLFGEEVPRYFVDDITQKT